MVLVVKSELPEIDCSLRNAYGVLFPDVLGPFLQDFAIEIIKSTHEHWRALVQKQTNSGGIEW